MATRNADALGALEHLVLLRSGLRGGRSRRHYQLEPRGADALLNAREQLSSLWAGLELTPRHSR